MQWITAMYIILDLLVNFLRTEIPGAQKYFREVTGVAQGDSAGQIGSKQAPNRSATHLKKFDKIVFMWHLLEFFIMTDSLLENCYNNNFPSH